MEKTYDLVLKIQRYDPDTDKSWIQEYKVTAGRILRFVDLFRKINDEQDPTLAWTSSCEHGQCGSCSLDINGKPLLVCELLVENAVDYFKTTIFHVKPLKIALVIRDLIIDFEKAYEKVHKVKPYIIKLKPLPEEEKEYTIFPDEQKKYIEATRCINCFCCASACMAGHNHFIGPNAAMASIIRMMDSREQAKEERLKLLYSQEGIYRCHTSKACSFVCPKKIDIAHYIALAKESAF